MRHFLPLLFSSVVFFSCSKHPSDCTRFRNGKFKIVANKKAYFIERDGDLQKEYSPDYPDSSLITLHVKWLNDYTYRIWPTAETYIKHPKFPKNIFVTNEIIETRPNSYVVRSTSNSTRDAFTFEYTEMK
jgi:hypothetical protein